MTGSGARNVTGGTLTLTGANQVGVTISEGSAVSLGNGGTSGSISGNLNNYGNVIFNRSDMA